MMAEQLEQCLKTWGLSSEKILMIVSDNGSNMIKAVRLLNERQDGGNANGDSDDDYPLLEDSIDGEMGTVMKKTAKTAIVKIILTLNWISI